MWGQGDIFGGLRFVPGNQNILHLKQSLVQHSWESRKTSSTSQRTYHRECWWAELCLPGKNLYNERSTTRCDLCRGGMLGKVWMTLYLLSWYCTPHQSKYSLVSSPCERPNAANQGWWNEASRIINHRMQQPCGCGKTLLQKGSGGRELWPHSPSHALGKQGNQRSRPLHESSHPRSTRLMSLCSTGAHQGNGS